MPLLTADSYDQIRAALDSTLDSSQLPDSVIDLPIFADAAEAEILARDPNAATYQTTDAAKWARVSRAVVLLVAAYIAPSLPSILQVRLGDYTMQRSVWDWQKQAARLRAMAFAELASYLETSGKPVPLGGMWLSSGRRGA